MSGTMTGSTSEWLPWLLINYSWNTSSEGLGVCSKSGRTILRPRLQRQVMYAMRRRIESVKYFLTMMLMCVWKYMDVLLAYLVERNEPLLTNVEQGREGFITVEREGALFSKFHWGRADKVRSLRTTCPWHHKLHFVRTCRDKEQ